MASNFELTLNEEDINCKFNNYKSKDVQFKETNIPSFNRYSSNTDVISQNNTCNFLTKNRNYFEENYKGRIQILGRNNLFFNPAINSN